mgnify:CR=1 FL=1
MKATLLFLILFFLVSCERTSNVSESRRVGTTIGAYINEYTIDGHDYIEKGYGMAHSGICRKCKQERDSIVNVIINTIENGRNNN